MLYEYNREQDKNGLMIQKQINHGNKKTKTKNKKQRKKKTKIFRG